MLDQVCLSDTLLQAAQEVFSSMIFMDIEPLPQPTALGNETLLSSITFKGDIEGSLTLCCDLACAKTIAGNMLGIESTDGMGEQEWVDAMGEVANMVMGSVKSRLQESTPNIEVSIPSVVSGREMKANMGDRMARTAVHVQVGGQYPAELCIMHRSRP